MAEGRAQFVNADTKVNKGTSPGPPKQQGCTLPFVLSLAIYRVLSLCQGIEMGVKPFLLRME